MKKSRKKIILSLIVIIVLIIAANKIFKNTYGLLIFEGRPDDIVAASSDIERYKEKEVDYKEYKVLEESNEKISADVLSSLIWQNRLNSKTSIASINNLLVSNLGEIPLQSELKLQIEGAIGKTRASYTYSNDGNLKTDLSAGISYILAHEKNGAIYAPDKVQQALWLMNISNPDIETLRKNTMQYKELLGQKYFSNFQAVNLGLGLYREANALQEYIDKVKEFKNKNNNQEIKDNNNYENNESGFVSYSESTKEYIIGPFSVDYVREVIPAADYSQTKNDENLVIMGEISNADLYGVKKNTDGNYEEVLLENWEFVYTDVEYTKATRTARRTAEIQEENEIASVVEKYGIEKNKVGLTKNPYPYPNEVFYIKIKDHDVEALTKIEFLMSTMDAISEVYELEGSYNVVNWTGTGENDYIPGSKEQAAKLYQVVSAKIIQRQKIVTLSIGDIQENYKIYSGVCIPLTMNFAGTVWYEGTEEDEQKGLLDGVHTQEKGIENIEVFLYNSLDELVMSTRTDADGKYKFNYIKIGEKYYVQFKYDGMKYKTTSFLGGISTIQNYIENPVQFTGLSHAMEEVNDRIDFNNAFNEITEDKAISKDGNEKDLTYTYVRTSYSDANKEQGTGSVAILDPIYIEASTKTAGIYYPLNSNYSLTTATSEQLMLIDKNSGLNNMYHTIGYTFLDSDDYDIYYVSVKDNDFSTNIGNKYVKTAEYMLNINLGLVERTPTDFAIVNDVVQTTFTLNEAVSNSNIANFGSRATNTDNDFDIGSRVGTYYFDNYIQPISYDSYNWRYDYVDNDALLENDELQLYVKYKMTIKNQSKLDGYISELVDYYDEDLYYPTDSNEMWRYYDKDTNQMKNKKGYANIVIPQISEYTSWALKSTNEGEVENLGQVEWNSKSKYGEKDVANNLNQMYTTSLENVKLSESEEIVIYVMFKVDRSTQRNKDGLYIANDNSDLGKRNIVEINGYRGINYNGTPGARVDKDSNPGNTDLENVVTYEDDIALAPYLRIIAEAKDAGKGISGYVWEDSRENGLGVEQINGQIVGNGILDIDNRNNISENLVNNVKAELIRLEYNKETGKYDEISFAEDYEERSGNKIIQYTGPQVYSNSASEYRIGSGQYRFDNLIESGTYKVRFTYGTEEQLKNLTNTNNSLKYNGHDYKSTEYAGDVDLNSIDAPSAGVAIVVDTTDSISKDTKDAVKSNVEDLATKLKSCNNKIDVDAFEYTEDNSSITSLYNAISSLLNYENKALVIFTDGKLPDMDDYKRVLQIALDNNIQVYAVGIDNSDEALFKVEGEYLGGKVVPNYYNLVTSNISQKLFDVIKEQLWRSLILEKNKSHATDYLQSQIIMTDTKSKNVFGRLEVMQYSQNMTAGVADVLNTSYINNLVSDSSGNSEWSRKIKELAENTQVTADSYMVTVNFEDLKGVVGEINLGLQEIPKSGIEVNNEVDDIIISLSNGQKIISLKEGATSNVQIIPNKLYSAYLDEELMQGATVDVVYKVEVNNVGEVDSLWNYLKYTTYENKMDFYQKLYSTFNRQTVNLNISEDELDGILFEAIPVNIVRLVNYSDNMIFRAEENNNWKIVNLKINMDSSGNVIRNESGKITYQNEPMIYNDRSSMRNTTLRWDKASTISVVDRVQSTVDGYQAVETSSYKNIDLYPAISTRVKNGVETSSICSYIKFSKTLSAQDVDIENSLIYNNYLEINEVKSINGRRDYEGVFGDYQPGTETEQRDTSVAERVIILPPFGKNLSINLLIIALVIVISVGLFIIIFIRRNKHK